MRAIARSTSNPRVADHLPVADPVIASMAATLPHDEFVAWLREWERLADADGAAQDAEFAHERRTVSMVENAIDGTWTLRGTFGAIQGTAVNEVLEQFTRAETEADWAAARAEHGAAAVADHLARTLTQRRTDIANAEPLCGTHNRLKERGFVPVRGPDGEWTILRPDGQPITPAV